MRYIFVKNFSLNEDGSALEGILPVSRDWEVFRDHFPGFPILPGALIIEAMAQHTVVLMLEKKPADMEVVPTLVQVDRAKFVRLVQPDCDLKITVKQEAALFPNFKFGCEAYVGDELAASARLTMAFREMPAGMGLDFMSFFLAGG